MSDASHLPHGGYDPTYASNLLLDGFDFDTDYGAGSDSARTDPALPRSMGGLSGLPEGLVSTGVRPLEASIMEQGEEYGLGCLEGLVREASTLTDLSWLEDAVQDPDRLPHSTNNTVIPELEEAWGVHRRTDGRGLVPNRDPSLSPRPSPSGPASGLPSPEKLRSLVAMAMRRSAYGESLLEIGREVVSQLGTAYARMETEPSLRKVAHALRRVRAEHGVVGRLYLRETAFPGVLTGRWDSEIRRRCARARYWLVEPGSRLAAYENYLGKRVVTEIPWGEALRHYEPLLARDGVRVAAQGTPRARLWAAMRAAPPTPASPESPRVAVAHPTQKVSLREAWDVVRAAPAPIRSPVDRTPPAKALRAAHTRLQQWVKAGRLKQADLDRLLQFRILRAQPSRLLSAAAELVGSSTPARARVYRGSGTEVAAGAPAQTPRDAVWARLRQAELAAELHRRARAQVESYREAGTLTPAEVTRILDSNLTAEEMVRVARARAADVNRKGSLPRVVERAYEGARYAAAPSPAPRTERNGEWARDQEQRLAVHRVETAQQRVAALVRAGRLSSADGNRLQRSGLNPEEMVRVALLRAEQQSAARPVGAVPRASYDQVRYTQHAPLRRVQAAPVVVAPPPRIQIAGASAPSSLSAPQFQPQEFDLRGADTIQIETAQPRAELLEGVELDGLWAET